MSSIALRAVEARSAVAIEADALCNLPAREQLRTNIRASAGEHQVDWINPIAACGIATAWVDRVIA
ncbi:hypothetical protein VB151_18750 [Xanthomonas fragariae]|uniref:hypothetical protein n=1 Tax=Xanthomonas fragariae TaxID=48664 RepID=UPI000326FA80|nr:hypothetical protein [Xanthomonas fragariae]AOD15707.1 hypothetical protein BER92_14570 [Xanthomonas fragariae]AOD19119.1 hypothetical protein BER93_14605 [Xanthomonas fragariae]ENZ95305.1 hypothetical protein O1K_09372 [Xanthomonas fragariae LMG 25863]MBL9196800.1 hypothetical protein [Xanthomonas fragariae]MBL9221303.1 hypothetical protein [Xanthomonas fragariae]